MLGPVWGVSSARASVGFLVLGPVWGVSSARASGGNS